MLVLIVGPSGAGKDTLLDAARVALADDPGYRFVRRAVTRPAGQGGEDYEPVTDAEFGKRQEAGAFALWWRAHGLQYGIPADIQIDLDHGRVVVASVSRTVIADAAPRFPVAVIEVTAPADMLARRLAARGREDAVSIAKRLSRIVELPLPVERQTVVNDGTIEQGAKRLVAALNRIGNSHGVQPRGS